MKKPNTRSVVLAAVCTLSLALTGCGAGNDLSADPVNDAKDFPFQGERLTVETDKDLVLLPAEGSTLRVSRKLAGQAAKEGNASWDLKGSTLSLAGKCSGLVLNCKAEYTVYVPKGTAVTVQGKGSAGVAAKGLDGALDLNLGRGTADVENASAPLKIRTDSGRINAGGLTSPSVDVGNDNGSIELAFAKAPSEVKADSNTGSITVRVPQDATRYRVSAKAGSTNPHIEVHEDAGSPRTITAATQAGVIRVNTKA
ncbi:DUF4097 family beta strand repeat-containing protein [Streptomyces sp. NPDC004111]|uniref:DUF4097 family beta strand repeat-containing protein n=1 Tax=Streptomyces sp. NPDC004111 TaxID=3364690 RepID=UPI0036AEA500